MRVSDKTWPRPSSSILAAMTTRFFLSLMVVGLFCAIAQIMKQPNKHSTIPTKRLTGAFILNQKAHMPRANRPV